MCKEILSQLHEIHQGVVHTNQNTSETTAWLNHVVRNVIKCDIVHWNDVGQSTISLMKKFSLHEHKIQLQPPQKDELGWV